MIEYSAWKATVLKQLPENAYFYRTLIGKHDSFEGLSAQYNDKKVVDKKNLGRCSQIEEALKAYSREIISGQVKAIGSGLVKASSDNLEHSKLRNRLIVDGVLALGILAAAIGARAGIMKYFPNGYGNVSAAQGTSGGSTSSEYMIKAAVGCKENDEGDLEIITKQVKVSKDPSKTKVQEMFEDSNGKKYFRIPGDAGFEWIEFKPEVIKCLGSYLQEKGAGIVGKINNLMSNLGNTDTSEE